MVVEVMGMVDHMVEGDMVVVEGVAMETTVVGVVAEDVGGAILLVSPSQIGVAVLYMVPLITWHRTALIRVVVALMEIMDTLITSTMEAILMDQHLTLTCTMEMEMAMDMGCLNAQTTTHLLHATTITPCTTQLHLMTLYLTSNMTYTSPPFQSQTNLTCLDVTLPLLQHHFMIYPLMFT